MRICSQDSTKTSLMSLKLALILVSYWYHYSFYKSGLRHHMDIISRNSNELRLFYFFSVLALIILPESAYSIACPIHTGSDQFFFQQCPCCLQRFIGLFQSIGNQGLNVFGHHALIPSRRILATMVLSDIGPCSNWSLSSKTVVMTRSFSKPTSHAMSRIQRSIFWSTSFKTININGGGQPLLFWA